jgi:hypothetical protein
MKFYRDKHSWDYLYKIKKYELAVIYFSSMEVYFFKNGKEHNSKNASYIGRFGNKEFCLNGKFYGNENDFTKQSWHKFIKLQAFL